MRLHRVRFDGQSFYIDRLGYVAAAPRRCTLHTNLTVLFPYAVSLHAYAPSAAGPSAAAATEHQPWRIRAI